MANFEAEQNDNAYLTMHPNELAKVFSNFFEIMDINNAAFATVHYGLAPPVENNTRYTAPREPQLTRLSCDELQFLLSDAQSVDRLLTALTYSDWLTNEQHNIHVAKHISNILFLQCLVNPYGYNIEDMKDHIHILCKHNAAASTVFTDTFQANSELLERLIKIDNRHREDSLSYLFFLLSQQSCEDTTTKSRTLDKIEMICNSNISTQHLKYVLKAIWSEIVVNPDVYDNKAVISIFSTLGRRGVYDAKLHFLHCSNFSTTQRSEESITESYKCMVFMQQAEIRMGRGLNELARFVEELKADLPTPPARDQRMDKNLSGTATGKLEALKS